MDKGMECQSRSPGHVDRSSGTSDVHFGPPHLASTVTHAAWAIIVAFSVAVRAAAIVSAARPQLDPHPRTHGTGKFPHRPSLQLPLH